MFVVIGADDWMAVVMDTDNGKPYSLWTEVDPAWNDPMVIAIEEQRGRKCAVAAVGRFMLAREVEPDAYDPECWAIDESFFCGENPV